MSNKNIELTKLNIFLNAIIDNIPDMIFIKEATSLKFIKLNKAAEDFLGIKIEDMLGKNDYDFFPKEQAAFFIKKDRLVLNSKTVLDIPIEEINSNTLGKIYLHTKKIPLLNEKNEPIYLLGISENITEKIRHDIEILKLNNELEKKVKQRTNQLSEKNKALSKEISDRKAVQKKLSYSILELKLLYEGQKIANEIIDIHEALKKLIHLICSLIRSPVGHAYMLNALGNELESSDIWYIRDEEQTKPLKAAIERRTVKLGVGLPGRVWDSGCPEWVINMQQEMGCHNGKTCSELNIYSAVGFPIVANGKVVAVCELLLEEKKEDTTLLQLFQILAKQQGNALEKRIIQEKLEASEARNRLLLQSSAEGIYGVNQYGISTFVNQAAARIMGYSIDELLGSPMHQLIHHSFPDGSTYPVEICPIYSALRDGKIHRITEEVMWRKDGIPVPVEYVSSPVYKNDKIVGAVVVFKDITERKKTEGKFRDFTRDLKRSNQDLDDFAYTLSHDLKSPLRAIERLANWISEDCTDKLDGKSKENLAILRKRVTRMSNFIDGLLPYARVGRTDFDICVVDTKELLKEIINTLSPSITFIFKYAENLPCFETAKIQLSQVFSNLISNSMKHHHRKTGVIEIGSHNKGDFYEFYVSDDGPGIEPGYYKKIFQIFQTLKSKDDFESTGIGLSIVKKIVEHHGGRVWVESIIEKGATFHFTWPKRLHVESNTPPQDNTENPG